MPAARAPPGDGKRAREADPQGRGGGREAGESRLTAAIPIDNPYCSCKLTLHGLQLQSLLIIPTAPNAARQAGALETELEGARAEIAVLKAAAAAERLARKGGTEG